MGIIWLSANKLGYELLKKTIDLGIKVDAILTLDDNSKTIMYDKIDKNKFNKFKIPVFYIKNINDKSKLLKKLNPEIIIMCGWRQIIKKEILEIPRKGVVGFHPTLLPIGRGPAPIINSLLEGFTKSGLTMFYLNEGLDDGEIIGQEKFHIDFNDHADDVYLKVINSGKKLIQKFLPLLILNKAPKISQDNSKATFFEKPLLKNNEIDLNESIEDIYKKIKALSKPYNGAYIKKDGKKLIIWRAEIE